MTVYKVWKCTTEAKCNNKDKAYDEMMIDGADKNAFEYFTSLEEAKAAYDKIKIAEKARKLHCVITVYEFEGKFLDCYEGCDEPEEDETLADACDTATNMNGIDYEISEVADDR